MPKNSQIGQAALGIGTGAVASGVDSALGLLLAGPQRKAQVKTAKALQDVQIAGDKELTDYNYNKQLQMWKDTSYDAQKEQMEKAGLNPSLMYGMGGGGGQTSNVATGSVSGQSAKAPEGMGIVEGAQLALMKAQKDNIEADTANKEADTKKKSGIDTQIATSTKQGIDLNNEFLSKSIEDRLDTINSERILKIEEINRSIGASQEERSTRMARIEKVNTEAITATLQNAVLDTQAAKNTQEIEAIKQEITQSQATINKMAQEVAQGWQSLSLKEKEIKIQGLIKEVEQMYMGNKVLGGVVIREHNYKSTAEQIDKILGTQKNK